MENKIKRFLSLALALFMVMGMMPTNIAFATGTDDTVVASDPTEAPVETPSEESSEDPIEGQNLDEGTETPLTDGEAKIGETFYATLAEAVEKAEPGATIVLLKDVVSIPTIDKAITIKGGEAGIEVNCAIAENFPNIEGTVTFEKLTFNERISTENNSSDQSEMTLKFVNCVFNVKDQYAIQGGSTGSEPDDVLGGLWIEGCIFNATSETYVGNYMVYAQCVNHLTIKNSTFNGNDLYKGAVHTGDSIEQASVVTISDNTICSVARGIQIGNRVEGSSVAVDNNTFTGVAATDNESKSGAIYVHGNADSDVSVTVNNNTATNCTNVMYNDGNAIAEIVTSYEGNTKDGQSIYMDADGKDTTTAPAPAISGTITSCLVDMDDLAETFIASEIKGLNANKSVVIKLYSGETQIATTTLLKSEYFVMETLGVKIIITGESSSWKTEWAEGMPRADMIPDKVVLYVDGEEMNSANVPMTSTNGELSVDWANVPGVNPVPADYAVYIGEDGYESLDAALAAAKAAGKTEVEITVLKDIAFSTAVKDFTKVTFTGTNREQTIDMNLNSAIDVNTELVFNDLTVSRLDSGWLYHYTYIRGGLTYNNCKMVGLFNVTVQDTTFNKCDFYNDDTFGNGNYSLWLYNCAEGVEVNVTDCTFDVYERAIKMYGDGYNGKMTLNISDTEFTSCTVDKTVVEMAYDNSTGVGAMNLNITDSTATGFGAPEHIEGETNAWFNVEGSNTVSTVTVDGKVVYTDVEPIGTITAAYYADKDGNTNRIWGESTMNASESVYLELYAGETKIATTTLVEVTPILDGTSRGLTWSFYIDAKAMEADGYWNTVWEAGYPSATVLADKVVMYADGKKVAENTVQMNAPDDLCFVVAATADAAGKLRGYYTTLANAVEAAQSGDTVTLLADVADAGSLNLPVGVTLDGNGKTISGNSAIYMAKDGASTIKNVNFKDIHNDAGKLSAIYATGLTSDANVTITGCTFENIDWDAIQMTSKDDVKPTASITGNIFLDDTDDAVQQKRHIHVELGATTRSGIDLTIEGNKFYGGDVTAIGAWYIDPANSTLALSHNYVQNPERISISYNTAEAGTYNANELALPLVEENLETEITYGAMVIKGKYEATYYDTLAEAVAAAESGDTVKLLADVALTSLLKVNGKSFTLEGNGHSITGTGALWLEYGTYNVQNVVFENINYTTNYGILEFNNATATVTGCTFTGNTAVNCIAVDCNTNNGTSNVTVDDCTFTGNTCSSTVINIADGTATVQDSKITDNTAGIAVIYTSTNSTVTGNYFSGNTINSTNDNKAAVVAGPWVDGTYEININGNAFVDNDFPGVHVEDWKEQYGAATTYDLNDNYWNGEAPNYGVTNDAAVDVDTYYTECNYENGVLTLTNEQIIPYAAKNANTGKRYSSVAEALDAAVANETVILLKNAEVTMVSVMEDITLDLNGYTLTAAYVTCFGDLIDGSEENSGVLKVSDNRFMIREDNTQLPIKSGEGYQFVEVLGFNTRLLEDGHYVFQPLFEEAAHELLQEGAAVSGVTINVRISWKQADGVRHQDFVYSDAMVSQVINSYNEKESGKYGKMFTLSLVGTENFDGLTYNVVVVSKTGVEFSSK